MKYYIVDAFSDKLFGGNQAGVCVLDAPISSELMQNIAIENNFSETAFLVKRDGWYDLKWFTPGGEIDFCGHATMGSAYVVKHFLEPDIELINFKALCGDLTVACKGELLTMNAPRWIAKDAPAPDGLEEALGVKVLSFGSTRDCIVLTDSVEAVKNMAPSNEKLAKVEGGAFIVTAKGDGNECDFVCRVFAPRYGIDEDPVTGSAHSTLIPYWAEKLGKTHLVSHQISKRGGVLVCDDLKDQDRVEMSGTCTCYLIGELQIKG